MILQENENGATNQVSKESNHQFEHKEHIQNRRKKVQSTSHALSLMTRGKGYLVLGQSKRSNRRSNVQILAETNERHHLQASPPSGLTR